MSQSQIRTRNRISLASHAGERGAPAGWIGAIFLHALIVVAVVFTFTHSLPLDITDESAPVVPVDLVTIAPKTNIIAQAKPEPKARPDITPEPLQPDQLKLQPPPMPQEETALPPPEVAPSKQTVKPPPVPVLKPPKQAQPDTKKSADDPMKSILNQWADAGAPKNTKAGDRNIAGVGDQSAMSADLITVLQSKMYREWHPDLGAPDAADLVVDIEIYLNPDGTVAQSPQLIGQSAQRAAVDPYMRAAAEKAIWAVYKAAPYKLPPDQYNTWRKFSFRFDPHLMMDP